MFDEFSINKALMAEATHKPHELDVPFVDFEALLGRYNHLIPRLTLREGIMFEVRNPDGVHFMKLYYSRKLIKSGLVSAIIKTYNNNHSRFPGENTLSAFWTPFKSFGIDDPELTLKEYEARHLLYRAFPDEPAFQQPLQVFLNDYPIGVFLSARDNGSIASSIAPPPLTLLRRMKKHPDSILRIRDRAMDMDTLELWEKVREVGLKISHGFIVGEVMLNENKVPIGFTSIFPEDYKTYFPSLKRFSEPR